MSKGNNVFGCACVFLIAGIIIVLMVFECAFPYLTSEEVTITVTDKERIVETHDKSISSKYLIFSDNETFENVDCLVRWKFDSSDLQGKLKRGETYHLLVYGWRVPFLSWYRNIVRISNINKECPISNRKPNRGGNDYGT